MRIAKAVAMKARRRGDLVGRRAMIPSLTCPHWQIRDFIARLQNSDVVVAADGERSAWVSATRRGVSPDSQTRNLTYGRNGARSCWEGRSASGTRASDLRARSIASKRLR